MAKISGSLLQESRRIYNAKQNPSQPEYGRIQDDASAQAWLKSAYTAIQDMQAYNNDNWDKFQRNYGAEPAQRVRQLLDNAEMVNSYLQQQRSIGKDTGLDSAMNQLRTELSNLDQQNQRRRAYFSQFGSQQEYDTALQQYSWRQKYSGQSVDQLRSAADALEDGAEKSWLTSYADQTEFNNNMAYDVSGGQRALQELQDKRQQMSILQQQIQEYQSNPLLMLTNYNKYNQMLSDYQAFHNQGGLSALDNQIRQTQQATLTAKQTQDAFRQAQEHNQWLKTVRDPETVSGELQQAQTQIQALQEKISLDKDSIRTPMGGIDNTAIQTLQQDQATFQQAQDQIAALEKELWYGQQQAYEDLMKNKDFEEKSKYVSTRIPGVALNVAAGLSGFRDAEYDYINRNPTAIANQTLIDQQNGTYFAGTDRSQLLFMSDDEIKIYNYLYATKGKDEAKKYVSFLLSDLNARQRQEYEQFARQAASSGLLGGAVASGLSVMMAPMKGIAYLGQAADFLQDGKIDQNAGYNRYGYVSKAIRDQVSQNIENNPKWGKAGAFGYQLAMSMGDFLLNAQFSGGSSEIAGLLLGTGAAADAVIDAKDRGLNDTQAFALGTIAGIAEQLTEKYSLETLLDGDLLKDSVKRYVVKNMLAEGSEEAASSLINLMADVIVSQDKSQWNQSMQQYQDAGYSKGEAFAKVLADQTAAIGLDALGGAISGGIMGGGSALRFATDSRNLGNALRSRGIDSNAGQQLAQAGVQAEKGSAAQVVSQQMQNKMDKGKQLSAEDMGRLAQANPEAASQMLQQTRGRVTLATPQVNVSSTDERWQRAQRLSSLTGRNIVFYNGAENENGYFDRDSGSIYVNARGGDPVVKTFSHELTHSAELADVYKDLQQICFQKLRNQGSDIAQLRQEKMQQYEREGHPLKNSAEADQEILANFVENYLLTDERTISEVVYDNPTIGQKILGWIDKVLAKLGNENAQERVFLRNARNMYSKALEQTRSRPWQQDKNVPEPGAAPEQDIDLDPNVQKKTPSNLESDVYKAAVVQSHQYSLTNSEISAIQSIGRKSVNSFSSANIAATERLAKQYWSDLNVKSPFFRAWFGDWRANDRQDVFVANRLGSNRIAQKNDDTGWDIQISSKIFAETKGHAGPMNKAAVPYLPYINDIVKKAILLDTFALDPAKIKSPNSLLMHSMYAVADIGNGPEILKLYVEEMNDPNSNAFKKRGYQLQNIEVQQLGVIGSGNNPSLIRPTATIKSVADLFDTVKQLDSNFSPNELSFVVDSDGKPAVVYHQTGEEFYIFDPMRAGAGSSDSKTPCGIFLKRTNRDIGLRGKRQMELYANIKHPLRANDRHDLDTQLKSISPAYRSISEQLEQLNFEYASRHENAGKAIENYLIEWRAQNPTASRRAIYDDPKFVELSDVEDAIAEEWDAEDRRISAQAKAAITRDLKQAGYDGIFLSQDAGSFGRSTDAIIALEPSQVKSVTENTGTFDKRNPDIRYSLSDRSSTQGIGAEQSSKVRDNLNRKASDYLNGVEYRFQRQLGDQLGIPRYAQYDIVRPIIRDMADEFLETGAISNETLKKAFDTAYDQGKVMDREFYDQYKDVKDYLRTTAVTLSQRDRGDIADFDQWRKSVFGSLRIVNEGGLPVDSAYRALQEMAPNLFPDRITHPADQLQRMAEVAKSIRKVEKSLDEYYGPEAAEFRKWARHDFGAAVGDMIPGLRAVKRYAEQDRKEAEKYPPLKTTKEVQEAFRRRKTAQKDKEAVRARHIMTAEDNKIVQQLLSGIVTLEELEGKDLNLKGIREIYEATAAYEQVDRQIRKYQAELRQKRDDEADKHLGSSLYWKDKKNGISYKVNTMRRNILDIVSNKHDAEALLRTYFEPVQIAEAARQRFLTEWRDKVREMNLSTEPAKGDEVSEAYAVQLYGEAITSIEMIQQSKGRIKERDGRDLDDWQGLIYDMYQHSPHLDKAKIENAVKEFRKMYDELFQMMNEVLIRNGYPPVEYRKGYFPHFQGQDDGIAARFGKLLGVNFMDDVLPTTINGLTHTFRPGKQWFAHAQERTGFKTTYDAVEGFDKYIEGVSNVIHHTDNIQRLRALSRRIRYRSSDEGIREEARNIQERDIPESEKETLLDKLYADGKFALSNFVRQLDDYTNILAGKKSMGDRNMEHWLNRKVYTWVRYLEGQVGANMVGGNISSAMTNFIPLTQAWGQLDTQHLLRGMREALNNQSKSDGVVAQSDFLTSRRGSDRLTQSWIQKGSATLSLPMEWIDNFTSEAIVRGAFYQNLNRGMSEDEALHQADIFAAGVMGDRSKGAMPTVFEMKNPFIKIFTQFQVEVNNQMGEILKDLPRAAREKTNRQVAAMAFKYFLGAWLYNQIFEWLFGRRPALDPINMIWDAGVDWHENGLFEAGQNLAKAAVENLPFVGGIMGGGRVPIRSALPDAKNLWRAVSEKPYSVNEETGKASGIALNKRLNMLGTELAKPAMLLAFPFAGNQVMKAWKGVSTVLKGGSYTLTDAGERELQYAVHTDDPWQLFGKALMGAVMGKSALPEAKSWIAGGFGELNAAQTALYEDLLEADVGSREALDIIKSLRSAQKTEDLEKKQVQLNLLNDSNISDTGKAIVYYGMMASEKERELLDALADLGSSAEVAGNFVREMYRIEKLPAEQKRPAQAEAFHASRLSEPEKLAVVASMLGPDLVTDEGNLTEYAKFLTAADAGLAVDTYMDLRSKNADLDNVLEFMDTGIPSEEAAQIVMNIKDLKPIAGEPSVSYSQRMQVILDSDLTEQQKLSAFSAVGGLDDSIYEKIKLGYRMGMDLQAYVDLRKALPKYDANGDGRYAYKEVQNAIDATFSYLGVEEKAILWQLQDKSWKPKSNPYDREVGQRVYDALKADSSSAQTTAAEDPYAAMRALGLIP